eukprot:scaffold85937_cov60-Phaeocystis_antarctica.AAC.3
MGRRYGGSATAHGWASGAAATMQRRWRVEEGTAEDGACVISRMAADVYKKGAACGTRVAEGRGSVE